MENYGLLIRNENGVTIRLADVPVDTCEHSRFNTRKSRAASHIESLAQRIKRNGFERTRAVWATESRGTFEVFAGGTRLEAAKLAGLANIPAFIHAGLLDDEISRKADEDNENDEYHTPVVLPDVWAEFHRLWKTEGWTQQRVADVKGVSKSLVSERVKWHCSVCPAAKEACSNGLLDEGHIRELYLEVLTLELAPWLTTNQAQSELVDEILSKHRGSSAGVKPSVKVVREAAKRWKALIQAATNAFESLPSGRWRDRFVGLLAETKARTEAAVSQVLSRVVRDKRQHEESEAAKLREVADAKEQEARRLQQQEAKLGYLESQTAKLLLGDARKLIQRAPAGFQLLLTDPPYGIDYQSGRRVTSGKKKLVAADSVEEAVKLLADVLGQAFPLMADNATCLVFTGWRNEPAFRKAVESAGFAIKGSLVWVKNNHGTGDLAGAFAPKHERIIHAVKGNPKLAKRAPDVLTGRDVQNSEHPMEKPRDLLRQLIEAVTGPGDTIVDPFAGSGGTLLESFALDRELFGIEIEESWHRIAVEAIHHMAERQFAE